MDTNQTDDKSYFYNINLGNNSIFGGDKSLGTVQKSSGDLFNTTVEPSISTEHETISVETLSDYDKLEDTLDLNFSTPFEERDVPGNDWTPPSELDVFNSIPDDFFKDSSNIIRVTVEVPDFDDDDDIYKPVTYPRFNVNLWLKVFGIAIAIIAASYGTYVRCTRRREVAEMNSDDKLKTVILIVPKSRKV